MAYEKSQILSKDEQKLITHHWPIPAPKARIVLVHGYAEHGKRYDHLASFLNKMDIDVWGYDQRGHGLSDGRRAYIDSFDDLVADLESFLSTISVDKPIFLFGHSMGGLVVTRFVQTRNTKNIKGLILSGPLLKLDDDLSPLLLKIIPILSKIFPTLPTEKLDKSFLTRSPDVRKAYESDPLVYQGGTRARTGAEMIKAIQKANDEFENISLPFLVMHGSADKLTDPEGSRMLYERASSKDKTIKIFPGLYHELINEPEKEEVMEVIGEWLSSRI